MHNTNTTADHHEVIGTTPKQQPGQAGHDGQAYLRTRRVETRVSPDEHATICAFATAQGVQGLRLLEESGQPVPRGRSGKACRMIAGSH